MSYAEVEQLATMMTEAGLRPEVTQWFKQLYERYRQGESGKLSWRDVRKPEPGDIRDHQAICTEAHRSRGAAELDRAVVIILNGGLGTSMKLDRAKSTLPVMQDGRSFLDLKVAQLERLHTEHRVNVPLMLMNSYRTRRDSLEALEGWQQPGGMPLDFVQHKIPRIDARTHGAVPFTDEAARWCPPGHGDIYLAMFLSGTLDRLIEQGYRWAFVSNSDNLGATLDLNILGYLATHQVPFAMEVTPKTLADVKGGTLVRYQDRLTLLERAQVEDAHIPAFEDVETFDVFNTNNLWWNLETIRNAIQQQQLNLPMIVNRKNIQGCELVQLEIAMGAAIGCLPGAQGLRVARNRFVPVKKTSDLMTVRSSAYVLGDDQTLRVHQDRDPTWGPPQIQLDPAYYGGLAEFEQRCPHPLNLHRCESLTVTGDVRFGRNVTIHGKVSIVGPGTIADGSTLEDTQVQLN